MLCISVFVQRLAQALAGSTQEAEHGRDSETMCSNSACKQNALLPVLPRAQMPPGLSSLSPAESRPVPRMLGRLSSVGGGS